ncbi:MAG: prepilin-type N-terminal cleavage/methylation domain-containing protein [Planctomycetota bacterium]
MNTRPPRELARPGFTLIELLVVISIIALLIGILLPALGAARATARNASCLSRNRQLAISMSTYAVDHKSNFAPNNNTGDQWYNLDTIGYYLPEEETTGSGTVGGTIFPCPNDPNAARTYAMNIWASSNVDPGVENTTPGGPNPTRGELFDADAPKASQLILFSERWSEFTDGGLVYARSTIGFQGVMPGMRFLGNLSLGLAGDGPTRWAPVVPTELNYTLHGGDDPTVAEGRVTMSFADVHASLVSESDLGDSATGFSTYEALWSPIDDTLE